MKDLEEYFKIFTDVWRFFKKYYDIRYDSEWTPLVLDADRLAQKYNSRLCEALILACFSHIDERFMETSDAKRKKTSDS